MIKERNIRARNITIQSANVSPVPKSSPALDIDSDFRPISLTPIVSKILESFLHRSRFYNSNVADCFESNPHKWWSSIKNIAGLGAAKNVSTVLYNGQSYSGSALANLFNDRFVAVGSTLPSFSWSPIAVDDVPLDFFISIDEVEKALISVKSHSAAGPDEISPWFLRENSASLSHPLASIFNASIQEGNIPLLWKSANVSPVPNCKQDLRVVPS